MTEHLFHGVCETENSAAPVRSKAKQAHLPRNGDANKLSPEDRAGHDWYRFVLSFPPHLVRQYLKRFGVARGTSVLDPFCGTGTTLVECKKLGISSIGIEAHPMAHFASRTKVDWTPDPSHLLSRARVIAGEVRAILEKQGIADDLLLGLRPRPPRSSRLWTLEAEQQQLLLKDSISPLPLHKALVLLDCIRRRSAASARDHHLLALAKVLVYSVSNLKFGPEVGVGPVKADAPVTDAWLSEVEFFARDLATLTARKEVPAVVYHGDSRDVVVKLKPRSVDAVITSPPYPNEKDYTRTTRLESVVLGLIRSKAELRAFKKSMICSNTRGVYKSDIDDSWVAEHPEIQRIAQAIENRRIELGKTSGFERLYPRATKLYFGGMSRHLAELRGVLKPGARLAYVVGDQASYLRVMIRTGELLADIATSLGYKVDAIDLFRTRLATATREQLREEVVVLTWPGD